jgi:hypothetical protein
MSDRLAKTICRICGEEIYFFIDRECLNTCFEATCPNGHSDAYSSSSSSEIEPKLAMKFARAEMAAAAG